MSRSTDHRHDESPADYAETVHRDYVLDVRIVERTTDDGETTYRFEAPTHEGKEFTDPDTAELYADVYFDVNGFDEREVGEQGIPLEVVQAGRDTLVAYLLTLPTADIHWVASFSGREPEKVQRYVKRLRERAASIRERIAEEGVAHSAAADPEHPHYIRTPGSGRTAPTRPSGADRTASDRGAARTSHRDVARERHSETR